VYHANRDKYMGDGYTEAMMLAQGFSIDMMVELANAGLATAAAERVVAGRRTIEVARVRITRRGISGAHVTSGGQSERERAGIECSECGGKGHRVVIGGKMAAPTKPLASRTLGALYMFAALSRSYHQVSGMPRA
jgi:hypothetical protein